MFDRKKERYRNTPNIGALRGGFQKTQREDTTHFGKVPPQAIELEEAVLGAAMIEREAVSILVSILGPDHFYKDEHRLIYEAMLHQYSNNKPIDLLTVADVLRKQGNLELVGGAYYLGELTNRVASSAHIEYHARIVQEKYLKRELIRICNETQRKAYEEDDVFGIIEGHEKSIFDLSDRLSGRTFHHIRESIDIAIDEIEKASKMDGLSGLGSGLTSLDRLTHGWQPSDLIVVGGRPGMGKTAFLLTVARNSAVDFGKNVGIVSAEMSHVQLGKRAISAEIHVDSELLRAGRLEPHQWASLTNGLNKLYDAGIHIFDDSNMSMLELRARIRRHKTKYGLDLLLVDYLQLLSFSNEKGQNPRNREQEISAIAYGLKNLAKELDIPVIALAQLGRSVETRGGLKKPLLSDLRESGAIEQSADQIVFLYRPEYYGFTEDEEGLSTAGICEAILAKNRHGKADTVRLRFKPEYTQFADLDIGELDSGSWSFTNSANAQPNNDDAPF